MEDHHTLDSIVAGQCWTRQSPTRKSDWGDDIDRQPILLTSELSLTQSFAIFFFGSLLIAGMPTWKYVTIRAFLAVKTHCGCRGALPFGVRFRRCHLRMWLQAYTFHISLIVYHPLSLFFLRESLLLYSSQCYVPTKHQSQSTIFFLRPFPSYFRAT